MSTVRDVAFAKLLGGSGGGGGGTSDYSDLSNKPQINSVTLSGNKSLSDLGIHNAPSGGSANQVLAKNSETDYDFKWVAQSGGDAHGIPSGGTANQVLAKVNSTNYNVTWKTNSLENLSDTSISYPESGSVLAFTEDGNWQSKLLRGYMGWIEDDGEGNYTLAFSDGYGVDEPITPGFSAFINDGDGVEYDFLWRCFAADEYGEYQSATFWFVCKDQSTPYDLKIRKFTATYDANDSYWNSPVEVTAAGTHEVSHTWIGTAGQYAALSPNYDAHTIYYITQ